MRSNTEKFLFRKKRVRSKVSGTAARPRLSIHRGHSNIYAQLIDDEKGKTLAAVSTMSPEFKGKLKVKDTIPAAQAVGKAIASLAMTKGIKAVVFDRGGYIYTGRIKAFADAAREGGLDF
jgi:large subunit ribosomal protein L18